MKKSRKRWFSFLIGSLLGLGAGYWAIAGWLNRSLEPMPSGELYFVRYEGGVAFDDVVEDLVKRKTIRDANAFRVYCYINRLDRALGEGTFQFHAGMTAREIHRAMHRKIEQQVRIPEGWWIARTAKILEEKSVCTAEDYEAAAADPTAFEGVVSFKLPETTLEGFLYPDTYELPPLIGAHEVIKRQLMAFEKKVHEPAKSLGIADADLYRAIIVASMVELEAAKDEERPKIAGVIENRVAASQNLEIDATVLYALQDWRVLGPGEVRTVESEYNTYLNSGLPPGPIGSPAWRSVLAALQPDSHPYYYYVARPNRTHYFSETYRGHQRNIVKARQEFKEGTGS